MAARDENNLTAPEEKLIKSTADEKAERKIFALKAGLFLTGVTVMSALAGFGTSVAAVKRREKELLVAAGFTESQAAQAIAREDGARLALRALGWGSLLAITGVSLIAFTAWKLSGAKDFDEFRMKVGSVLPKIPKKEGPGRSEFDNFNDFLDYVSKKPTNV